MRRQSSEPVAARRPVKRGPIKRGPIRRGPAGGGLIGAGATFVKLLACERGAPSIEFALLLPLLLVFLTGIIDGGFVFHVQHAMEEASRSAARAYAVDPDADVAAIAGQSLPKLAQAFEVKKSVGANGLATVQVLCPAGNATLIGFIDAFRDIELSASTGIPKEW